MLEAALKKKNEPEKPEVLGPEEPSVEPALGHESPGEEEDIDDDGEVE